MEYKIGTDARCAVIGYGSWATAIVGLLAANGRRVGWYVRNPEVLESLCSDGRNPRYLNDLEFDRNSIAPSSDLDAVVRDADIVILATPSAYLKDFLAPLTVPLRDKFVVSAIKGIVPGDYQTVVEYIHDHYGLSYRQIGLVTGPSHAEEVSRGKLSYLTVVCADPENARRIGERFAGENIRLSYSADLYGVEYAAILKNIYALSVGIAVGLGYGDNFLAVLIANAAGTVAIEGWLESSTLSAPELIGRFIPQGLTQVICTDISRDGMLCGPSAAFYADLQGRFPTVEITVSGGISSMSDIEELDRQGLRSVIVGKALYEGRITLKDLARCLPNA